VSDQGGVVTPERRRPAAREAIGGPGGASRDGIDVARRLLALLATESLRAGDRIPSERALSEALGAPRSVVREALRSLLLIGLLESHPGRGTFICATDSAWVSKAIEWGLVAGLRNTMDLVETSTHLEVISARMAAERRDDGDLEDLQKIVDALRAAEPDRPELVRLDVAFHLRLARATKSEVLAYLLASVETLLHVWIARVLRNTPSHELHGEMYVEHAGILDAVAASDPARAAALMDEAMRLGERHLREALLDSRTPDPMSIGRGLLVTQPAGAASEGARHPISTVRG
jgi:GntR family transcriptional repressor for pyruvate dehydrogenase complex